MSDAGAALPLDVLTQLYLVCQRYYSRPALSLLSAAQAKHYIGPIRESPLKDAQPAMYELLTSKDTRPEYFQTIIDCYMQTAQIRAMATSQAEVKQMQAQIDEKVFREIELAEQQRKNRQKELSKQRRLQKAACV